MSASSVNVAVNAVRFLYGITLGRNTEGLTTRGGAAHWRTLTIRRAEIYVGPASWKRS